MNHSGDAAEQIVRMSLEGVEVAAKISGSAAKEMAVLLLTALKSPEKSGKIKLRGKERLTSMLQSGKALEIFSVKEGDLKQFMAGAKQYGIVYCALRNTKNNPDGLCDILVKAEDAPKINRLVERFKFATVDKAKIESEIVKNKAENAADIQPSSPDVSDTEKLLDDLLGVTEPEGKTEPDMPQPVKSEPDKSGNGQVADHPLLGGQTPQNVNPSEPTSASNRKSENHSLSKPSVKETLRDLAAAKKEKEADKSSRDERESPDRSKGRNEKSQQAPQKNKKPKSKKSRERN